ncbi:MAG: RtcB family protein, partial [Bacteroidota bacterium]
MAKIKKKHLIRMGFEANEAIKAALAIMDTEQYRRLGRVNKMEILQAVLNQPEQYIKHQHLGPIALGLITEDQWDRAPQFPEMRAEKVATHIYGEAGIDPGAIHQMYVASKLPVAQQAALMPDAHQGYGLPIGGVLATDNAVIPYAVGLDIGCRMALSVFDLSERQFSRHRYQLEQMLREHTFFGAGRGPKKPMADAVLERSEFKEIPIVRELHRKAAKQIGSSGGGNHFVEFGLVQITDPDNEWALPTKTYLGILSH